MHEQKTFVPFSYCLDNTIRYLGVEMEDALNISEDIVF